MMSSTYNSEDATAAAESLSVMLRKEQTTYTSCDYLHQSLDSDESLITASDRLQIVDWCYSATDHCNLNRETVAIAMGMVDRFLSKPSPIACKVLHDRIQFQLLAMSALNIAIKTTQSVVLGSEFLSHMGQGMYSVKDIDDMEMELLQGLSWRVCAPTSIQIAHYVMAMLVSKVNLEEPKLGFILDEVGYQTEHAVRDYDLSMERPSTVAVAAILNSLKHMNQQDRQDILGALKFVLNEEFAPAPDLLFAINRLQVAVKNSDENDDDTVVADLSTEAEICTLNGEVGTPFDEQKTHVISRNAYE